MNKEFKVKDIFQPQQVSEKLRKQEVLFTWNDGRWDHDVVIQFLNDRIDSLVQLNIGDTVEVGFDVESRRWEKDGVVRYFTSCTGWNVKIVGMLKDEKVSGSVVLVLWVVKKEIEEYMIDNNVEMKGDDEVKQYFARQFTDGHRLRLVLRNLASRNTLPLAHLYLRQILSKYDDWNLDAIFKRYHDLVESKTDSQLLNYLK